LNIANYATFVNLY